VTFTFCGDTFRLIVFMSCELQVGFVFDGSGPLRLFHFWFFFFLAQPVETRQAPTFPEYCAYATAAKAAACS